MWRLVVSLGRRCDRARLQYAIVRWLAAVQYHTYAYNMYLGLGEVVLVCYSIFILWLDKCLVQDEDMVRWQPEFVKCQHSQKHVMFSVNYNAATYVAYSRVTSTI